MNGFRIAEGVLCVGGLLLLFGLSHVNEPGFLIVLGGLGTLAVLAMLFGVVEKAIAARNPKPLPTARAVDDEDDEEGLR